MYSSHGWCQFSSEKSLSWTEVTELEENERVLTESLRRHRPADTTAPTTNTRSVPFTISQDTLGQPKVSNLKYLT